MKITMRDIKDLLVISGIAIVSVIAAFDSNWTFVTSCVTGAFALLNLKGNENEKSTSVDGV